ncbi:MAG TPA: hypothetical protein VG733_17760, partial [Chthoniobacteraceae bacterium]|nr:hypothetical protein [Chthoniobacteraceae bacterium]
RGDCPQSPAPRAVSAYYARLQRTQNTNGWRAVEGNSPYRSLAIACAYLALLLLALRQSFAQELSPLAKPPDWSRLEIFQNTITHDEFAHLLNDVYAPDGVSKATIVVTDDAALIAEDDAWTKMFTLHFAKPGTKAKPAPHYWHEIAKLPRAPKKEPLKGVTIALDPGHLGGKWARMEERWYVIGDSKPVAEGDMTLLTAKILAKKLRALGATVVYARSAPGPVTDVRPADLQAAARAELKRQQFRYIRDKYDGPTDELRQNSVQWESELLFYRNAEIHARGRRVNGALRPDLTLCMHYNAEPWHDETKPTLSDKNHFHLLINGSYEPGELALDDVRFEMLFKLLTRSYPEELAISKQVAATFAHETGLPAYTYPQPSASVHPVPGEPYIWLRNLLANRLYRNPTIYIEPYVMNNQLVFDRVQAGDYPGEKEIDGAMRKSIYREYADAVADGLVAYFKDARKK